MSRENFLQDFIIDLKIELEQLEEKLKSFEEIKRRYSELQIILKYAQEKYNLSNIELKQTTNTTYQKSISTIDAVLEYLTEQQNIISCP